MMSLTNLPIPNRVEETNNNNIDKTPIPEPDVPVKKGMSA